MRTGQARLIEDFLPRVAVPAEGPLDLQTLFAGPPQAMRIEIGFGGGEHLAREALAHPQTGFIGCEPFINGVAKLLTQIEGAALDNVRVHSGDARAVLSRLSPGSIDRVDLLYPDPWPKRRQRKRRFVSDETLALIAACLKPGGVFRFASDIDDYAGWTLAHVLGSPHFRWTAERPTDWREPWAGWQPTRYEQKARREGRDSAYLTFIRS